MESVCSIVPQFTELADAKSLLVLAHAVVKLKLSSDELSNQPELINKIIEIAISKLDFFKPKKAYESDPNLASLRECIELCLALQCPEAIILLVDKAWTTGMSTGDAENRVENVISPLLSFLANLRSRGTSDLPKQAAKTLARIVIETLLGPVGPAGEKITVTVIRSLVTAATYTESGVELIATM